MTHLIPLQKRILIGFLFYFIFGTMYWLANSLQTGFKFNMWQEALVDYSLKGALTVPVWLLLFVYLKNEKLSFRLKIHLITCPLYVFLWFKLFRIFAEAFDLFYLKGTGKVWDIYIPTLFYFLQFGFFHAYEYWENNQFQMQREQQLKEAARVAEINNYKAQLQPHFLFNTLNSINATLTADNEPARELIAKLADTFRYAMKISNKELILLREEIDFNKICLELEKARFSDRLQVVYVIDERLLENLVPPMILQPLIENAIKHGISKSVSGGIITISIQQENQKMVFEITDTGLGLTSGLENASGIGLSNTKKRLEVMYGEVIELIENKPSGVKVLFKIPIQN
ncbi:MAG: histidine kinase [Burkholderiales bacterium]|nr:histidine kinase [Flavobacterium sp.]